MSVRDAVSKARIGHSERLKALRRLGEWGTTGRLE